MSGFPAAVPSIVDHPTHCCSDAVTHPLRMRAFLAPSRTPGPTVLRAPLPGAEAGSRPGSEERRSRIASHQPCCLSAPLRSARLQERASGKAVKQSEAQARLQEAEDALDKERRRLGELQVGNRACCACCGDERAVPAVRPPSWASRCRPDLLDFVLLRPPLQERANREAVRRADTEARFADAWRQLQAEREALAAAQVCTSGCTSTS